MTVVTSYRGLMYRLCSYNNKPHFNSTLFAVENYLLYFSLALTLPLYHNVSLYPSLTVCPTLPTSPCVERNRIIISDLRQYMLHNVFEIVFHPQLRFFHTSHDEIQHPSFNWIRWIYSVDRTVRSDTLNTGCVTHKTIPSDSQFIFLQHEIPEPGSNAVRIVTSQERFFNNESSPLFRLRPQPPLTATSILCRAM